MRFSTLFALACAFALALPAAAQKPQPRHALEVGADPVSAIPTPYADGVGQRSGLPSALFGLDAVVVPASPADMATAFLGDLFVDAGVRSRTMEVTKVREGGAGTTVRMHQVVDGVPVWGTDTAVTLSAGGRVQTVFNGSLDIHVADLTPSVSDAEARSTALAHLGMATPNLLDQAELMIWPGDEGARLAWVVRVAGREVPGDWEIVVDARSGELVRVADRRIFHGGDDEERPTALPLVEMHPAYRAEGVAAIFDPDPLTRAGVPYGGGYVDGGDASTPELDAARVNVTLRDITLENGVYSLAGPWAEIFEVDSPNRGLFSQERNDWTVTRTSPEFEAATTYWHIDNYMRYVHDLLDFDVRPQAYTGGVRFDPHGVNGSDNSYFSSGPDVLSFGEGCVDDAEDADVIIHELGHGLHDWLSAISNGAEGLSEGFGDYVATSYTRSLGLLSPSDQSYNWVFKWDGHNPCWPGRITNLGGGYPSGNLHSRGRHWSSSLMRVWDQIGGEKTDRAVFEGIAMTNRFTTQPQAAQAVLQAAANLGYTSDEVQAFFDSFTQQGYTNLTFPTNSEEVPPGELPVGGSLSQTGINPFFGHTEVELLVDTPQRVTVEVLDALGRRVATLMSEEVLAGRRYPIAIESGSLRAGLYIVRARGETFEATRRVTLVR